MAIRVRVSRMFVAAALVVGTLMACSSSDSASEPTSEAGFCDALSSAYAKCGGGASGGGCGTAMSADCTKLASILSPSILDGAKSCVQTTECGKDPVQIEADRAVPKFDVGDTTRAHHSIHNSGAGKIQRVAFRSRIVEVAIVAPCSEIARFSAPSVRILLTPEWFDSD